jgi:drug/metabolite transporter (DMT)-like permease
MRALWGLPYLLIKVAVAELDPAFLVFVRLSLAAIVLLPIAWATGSLKRLRRRSRRLVTVAVVGIAIPFALIAYGEQHITSSLTALLIAADPLFVVLLALPIDASERMTRVRLVGLLIGLIGVTGVAVTLSVAAIALAPPALSHAPQAFPSPLVIGSVVALGIVCTALGYFLYYSLIAEAGATRASLITYVNPAVAVLLGVVILGEPLTWATLVGFALIVFGCALATGVMGRSPTQQRARVPETSSLAR